MPMRPEKYPRFGSPDLKALEPSRMNPLNKKLANGREKPASILLRENIRSKLRASLYPEGKLRPMQWPPYPQDVSTLEELFSHADQVIHDNWTEKISPLIRNEISESITAIPQTDENASMLAVLQSPALLEQKLRIRQFGDLEPLRKEYPELWKTLLHLSSERQMALMALVRHWVRNAPASCFETFGMNQHELNLFIQMNSLLGKYVDHAFIKQTELADQPGGSEKSLLSRFQGAEYMYDFYAGDSTTKLDKKTYGEVLPFEISGLSHLLKKLADQTTHLLGEGKIPATYQLLPSYLVKMADVYGSNELSPKKLFQLWKKELLPALGKLVDSGCPILPIPQDEKSVARDANKVDIEIRFALSTKSTKSITDSYGYFQGLAHQIVEKNKAVLSAAEIPIPRLVPSFEALDYGPNGYWRTRAQEGTEIIHIHVNAIRDVALTNEMAFLKKAFGADIVLPDPDSYAKAATLDTGLHEIAHTVLSPEDAKVHERVGDGPLAKLVEETKAETGGMLLLFQGILQNETHINVSEQFWAKLGTVCDFLINKSPDETDSGGRYHLAGRTMIYELLQKGILQKTPGGKYAISDPLEAIKTIAGIGDEIIGLYADSATTPRKVEEYARNIIALKDDPGVNDFIDLLRQ